MKCFAALFFSLFALNNGSSATQCTSNATADMISLLSNEYIKFVDSLAVPALEYKDEAAGEFKNLYTTALRYYSLSLVSNLHGQAKDAGEELIHDIQEAIDELKKAIQSMTPHNETPNCLEDVLKQVIRQMNIFLSLKPENTEFEMPELPPMPEQPIKIKSRTKKRTLEEIFLNFVRTADDISRQVYAYLANLYLGGWFDVRKDFEVLRIKIYKQILKGSVLKAYKRAVNEVNKRKDSIRSNVLPETWESFYHAADHIIAI